MNNHQLIRVKAWTKAIVLMLLAVLFGVFLLLNAGAVIEPRVHLVFAKYDRPGLLVVLLVTTAVGFIAGFLVRTVSTTLHQLREARQQSGTARLEHELAQLKAASTRSNTAIAG